MIIGIIGAMKEEVLSLRDSLQNISEKKLGVRTFIEGNLYQHKVVMCLSGWGKTAAASTTTSLINIYNVDCILFVGLAGSLQNDVNIGDIVIGNELIQHDVDLRDFSQIGTLNPPFYKSFRFASEPAMLNNCKIAIDSFIEKLKQEEYPNISCSYQPKKHVGAIGTGDQFVGSPAMKKLIVSKYPELLCTEMEGATIAQIANDYSIPCAIIRIISDNAEDGAHSSFVEFLFDKISTISVEIIKTFIKQVEA